MLGRLPPSEAGRECADADVLALSLDPWNERCSVEVARRVKAGNPSCLVVGGGPAVPRDPAAAEGYLRRNQEIDLLVIGEGEAAFCELLAAHGEGRSFDGVPGIAFRSERSRDCRITGARPRRTDFPVTASPFLDGTFDDLLDRDGSLRDFAIFETNRGCPYGCTFCGWGHSDANHVAEIPLERVSAELDWIAAQGIQYLYIIDANFGIRPRDVDIIRHIAELRRRTGYPEFCHFHLRKNARMRDLEMAEVLLGAGVGCRIGLAAQDFDARVLAAVRRRDIDPRRHTKLREACGVRGIPTFDEIILGLPEQSLESFCRTVVEAMSPFSDDSFHIYLCRICTGSEMADPEYRSRYGIETRSCVSPHAGSPPEVDEFEEIVVATGAMPGEDWRRAFEFGSLAAAVSNGRLLRVVLQYLRESLNVDLRRYLEALAAAVAAAAGGGVLAEFHRILARGVDSIRNGGPCALPVRGAGRAPREIGDALAIVALRSPEGFFEEVGRTTESFFASTGLPGDALSDLIEYESFLTPRHGSPKPVERVFAHDWRAYARGAGREAELIPGPVALRFLPPPYASESSFEEFIQAHLTALRSAGERGRVVEVARDRRDGP